MKKPTKRQHTVPKSLLKRFSLNGKSFYALKNRKPDWLLVNVSDATVVNHIYTFTNQEGEPDTAFEDAFCELEGKTVPVFDKIDNGLVGELSKHERLIAANFIVAQLYRTRRMRDMANNAFRNFNESDRKLRFIQEIEKELLTKHSQEEVNEYKAAIEAGTAEPYEDNDFYVRHILSTMSQRVRNIFLTMNWRTERIKSANDQTFLICSDNPMTVRRRGRLKENEIVGVSEPSAEVYFPISRFTMLIGSHDRRPNEKGISQMRVNELNKITLVNRHDFIYAPCKSSVIERLRKEVGDFRIPTPVEVKEIFQATE